MRRRARRRLPRAISKGKKHNRTVLSGLLLLVVLDGEPCNARTTMVWWPFVVDAQPKRRHELSTVPHVRVASFVSSDTHTDGAGRGGGAQTGTVAKSGK